MRSAPAILALLATGCFFEPHPLEGRACDEGHLCPAKLQCLEGVCRGSVPDPSADGGLLPNGGFEQGLLGWEPGNSSSALEVQGLVRRSGEAAVRVTLPGGGTGTFAVRLRREVLVGIEPGTTLCSEAWVRQELIGDRLRLTVRRYELDGSFVDSDAEDPASRVHPQDEQWHRIVAGLPLPEPFESVNLRVSTSGAPGGIFYVDDVSAWTSATGGCG